MTSALEDDLNTAQAQAAIFDMVRKANAPIDSGQLKKDDVAPLLAALESSTRSSPSYGTTMRPR